jgi:hypothetical protein
MDEMLDILPSLRQGALPLSSPALEHVPEDRRRTGELQSVDGEAVTVRRDEGEILKGEVKSGGQERERVERAVESEVVVGMVS